MLSTKPHLLAGRRARTGPWPRASSCPPARATSGSSRWRPRVGITHAGHVAVLERELALGLGEERARLAQSSCPRGSAHTGICHAVLLVARRSQGQEARLLERQSEACPRRREPRLHEGQPRLSRGTCGRAWPRRAWPRRRGRSADRTPVAPPWRWAVRCARMPFWKLLGAHPVLEHADDARALLVGDAVEGVADVVVALDLLADLARRDEAVAGPWPGADVTQRLDLGR